MMKLLHAVLEKKVNCNMGVQLQYGKASIISGGIHATNLKAVNFYKKNGYQFIASSWHDEKDNHDMIKNYDPSLGV